MPRVFRTSSYKLFVRQKFSGRASAVAQICGDYFYVIGYTVEFTAESPEFADGVPSIVIKALIGYQFSGSAASGANFFRNCFELGDRIIQTVVKLRVIEKFARAAVAAVDFVQSLFAVLTSLIWFRRRLRQDCGKADRH